METFLLCQIVIMMHPYYFIFFKVFGVLKELLNIKQKNIILIIPKQVQYNFIYKILTIFLFFIWFLYFIHVPQDSPLVLQSDRNVTVNARNHMGQLTGQLTVGECFGVKIAHTILLHLKLCGCLNWEKQNIFFL